MGPVKYGFWFPPVRLGAFFALVVLLGTLILGAARPSAPSMSPAPDAEHDFFGRRKRQMERHYRSIERFFGVGAPSVSAADPLPEIDDPFAGSDEEPAAPVPVQVLAMAVSAPTVESPPLIMDEGVKFPVVPRELAAAWFAQGETSGVLEAADGLLALPEFILDGLWAAGAAIAPRPEAVGEGITSRLLDFRVEARKGRIASEFLGHWVEREQRFFSRFAESGLSDAGVEDGTEDVDLDPLASEQGKILWDAFRKTYLSKYKFRAEDRIRDDAFYFSEWRGVDFVVLPPLMAGYLWYRGIEKKVSVGGTWLRCSLEPFSRWERASDGDLPAALTLEWSIKTFPVGLIVSTGYEGGRFGVDFVGLGTSAGLVKRLLIQERD